MMSFKYFCIGLFFVGVLMLSPAYGDINLLTNPGFEEGSEGWHAFGGCKFKTSTTVCRGGLTSGYAYSRTQDYQGIAQSLLGKMQADKTYSLAAWVRLEGTPGSSDTIKATIKKIDDSGTSYDQISASTVSSDQWSQLSGQYTLTVDGTLTGLDIYFEGPVADVNFYVDDVNMFGPPVAPADPNTTDKGKTAEHKQQMGRLDATGTCDVHQPAINSRKNKACNLLFA